MKQLVIQLVVLVVLSIVIVACKKATPKTPPKKAPAPSGNAFEGTLSFEKRSPGKDGATYRAGSSAFHVLAVDTKKYPKLAGCTLIDNKVLIKFKDEALKTAAKELEGQVVVVKGSVHEPDNSNWDNPNNMQALVSMGPNGERITLKPGSAGYIEVTGLAVKR